MGQLGEVSNAMRVELEEQNVMLDEITTEADQTHGMLQGANKQVTELLKHAGSAFSAFPDSVASVAEFSFPLQLQSMG